MLPQNAFAHVVWNFRWRSRLHRSEQVDQSGEDLARETASCLGRLVGRPELRWSMVALASRPVPADGLPCVGAVGPEGLYLAVMHSGATLAAGIGEALAAEILEGKAAELLDPFRPARFQTVG
ncbi:MAG: hypothetical protein MRY81_13975 [Donghicola eburneus]|jgi:glycine/D-amino acid oxidase-like deaminating enzyme|nr:hypothetical protein [Donghicola eburneus]MCI5040779.1 hypothetical protein [Donghicola eburneus]